MTVKKQGAPARNPWAQYALHLIPQTEFSVNSYTIKNVISFVMALTLIFSLFVSGGSSCYAFANLDNQSGDESFRFLKAVGVMPESEAYKADAMVTRGQFVHMAIGLSGIKADETSSAQTDFADVSQSHPYATSIAKAKNLGIISGNTNGSFDPDSPINYNQAMKILCDILDYSHIASGYGGYPHGYVRVGKNIGLDHGVTADENGNLTMASASVMIANAANAEVMMVVSMGDTVEYQTRENSSVLSERLGVHRVEGVIEANDITDMYAEESTLGAGCIQIEDLIIDASATDAREYVGYYAEIFFTGEKSDLKAVYMNLSSENKVVSCDVRDLSMEKGILTYEEDEDTLKKINVEPDASYFVNGKLASMRYSQLPNIEKGSVQFVSNDSDSAMEVVYVTSYETLIVSGVGAATNRIAIDDGTFVELDPDDDDYIFEIYKDGNVSSIGNIVPGSVILLAESTGKGVNQKKVYVSDKVVSGVLEEKGVNTLVVGGEKYLTCETLSSKLNVGKRYDFLLDYFGEVVDVRNLQNSVYGYLFAVAKKGGFDEVRCKILSENNHWVELDFQSQLKYNGNLLSEVEVYNKILAIPTDYRGIIRYNVNADNEVSNIEVAEDMTEYGLLSDEALLAAENNVFRKSYSGNQVWRSRSNSFEGKICADNDCVIFYIPDNAKEEDIAVMKIGTIPSDESYDIVAYDVDQYLNAPVVTIKKLPLGGGTSSNFFFVTGKGESLNYEGDAVPSISGYWRGFEVSVQVKLSATLTEADIDALAVGTPILFSLDDKGMITKIVDCSPDENGYFNGPSGRGAYYTSSCQAGGIVVKNDYLKGHLVINSSLNGDYYNTQYSDDTKVYIYNKLTGEYSEGTVADIVPGDIIISKLTYFFSSEIAVIRNNS